MCPTGGQSIAFPAVGREQFRRLDNGTGGISGSHRPNCRGLIRTLDGQRTACVQRPFVWPDLVIHLKPVQNPSGAVNSAAARLTILRSILGGPFPPPRRQAL